MNWIEITNPILTFLLGWLGRHLIGIRKERHTRQIDGYFELIDIMQKMKNLVDTINKYYKIEGNLISFKHLRETRQSSDIAQLINFSLELGTYINDYRDKFDRWFIFFDKDLENKFRDFYNCFLDFDCLDLDKIYEAYESVSNIAYKRFRRGI